MKLKKILSNRIIYLCLLVAIVCGIVIARLYVLQIKNSEKYESEARIYAEYELPLDAPRGNIYDRNGVLLASNRTAYKLYMISTSDDQAYRDQMYLELIEIMEENGDTYYNYLEDYLEYPLAWGDKTEGEDGAYNKKAWINSLVTTKSDKDFFDTPENAFNFLRYSLFDISDEYTEAEAYKIMIFRYNWFTYGLDTLKPTVFATDVCQDTIDEITAKSNRFHGVTSEKTYFRTYLNSTAMSSIIGYVRAIDEDEYEELKDQGYYANDVVGKMGIELTCESYLCGTRGTRVYAKDTDGNIIETDYVAPVAGNDVYLTIDSTLQTITYESVAYNVTRVANMTAVANHNDCDAGVAVVSDPTTGELLALVTYPSFDNSIFTAKLSDEEAQAEIEELLSDDESHLTWNRATQSAYPIGSMVKPFIAIAGLEAGVIDSDRTIDCKGYILAAGHKIKCLHVHNQLNLAQALAGSCNVYFAQTGIETGIDTIDKWLKAFGLGEATGIELTETLGHRSNPATMDIYEAGTFHKWSDASTAQTSIGQLYTTFTPIQANRAYAAIANNGVLTELHLVLKVVDPVDSTVVYETPIVETDTGVSDYALSTVQDALNTVVDEYADLRAYLKAYEENFISGKTGTAQTGTNEESSHAFYTGYMPAENPQICVTLLLEHGYYSGTVFYTLRDIANCYFGTEDATGRDGLAVQYSGDTLLDGYRSAMAIVRKDR